MASSTQLILNNIIILRIVYVTMCANTSNWRVYENGTMLQPVGDHQISYLSSPIPTVFQYGGFTAPQNPYSSSDVCKWQSPISIPPVPWTYWSSTINSGELKIQTAIKASVTIDNLVYFAGCKVSRRIINKFISFYDKIAVFNMSYSARGGASWWYLDTRMPNGVENACVETNRTHIFIIGGVRPRLNDHLDTMQILNINTLTWTIVYGPSNIIGGWASQYCAMTKDSILYVFGGKNTDGDIMGDIYKYQTAVSNPEWKQIGNKSVTSADGYAVYDPKYDIIHLIGGIDKNGERIRCVDRFDVKSEKLVAGDDLVFAVSGAPAVIIMDEIWVFGGRNATNNVTAVIQIGNLMSISQDSLTNIGAIIGIVVGVVIGIGCFALIIWMIRFRGWGNRDVPFLNDRNPTEAN